jgi:hypothetical protein
MVGSCDHGNELLESIKGGRLLNYISAVSFSRRTCPLELVRLSNHKVNFSYLG